MCEGNFTNDYDSYCTCILARHCSWGQCSDHQTLVTAGGALLDQSKHSQRANLSLTSPSQRWLGCSTWTAIFTIWETYYRWLFKHNFSIFSKVYDKASIKIFVNHPNVRLIRFVKVLGLFGKELAVLKAKALFPDNISVEIQDPHCWLIGFIIQWYTAWRLMALISRGAAGPRGDNCSEQLHSTPPESSTDGLQPYLL